MLGLPLAAESARRWR